MFRSKLFCSALLLLLICAAPLAAQDTATKKATDTLMKETGLLEAGMGVVWIDGKSHFSFTITPDISLGKLGAGLRIELLFDMTDNFKFRKVAWEGGAGAWRMIDYIRWGKKEDVTADKKDPVYVKIGRLENAYLGHGFILGYYNNAANYEQRKIGMALDLDFGTFGLETLTSTLGMVEVLGGRIYYRPLFASKIPVFDKLEIGATFVGDFDLDGSRDKMMVWGLDLGLPVLRLPILHATLYADFAQIVDYGNGVAAGLHVGLPGLIGLFRLDAKLEYRNVGDKFIPTYFNALYDMERKTDKPLTLDAITGTSGWFGELSGQVLGIVKIVGNYQQADGVPNSGILHVEAGLQKLIPGFKFIAAYDKTGLDKLGDMFTFDERSVASMEIRFRLNPFLVVSMLYRWNFIWNEEQSRWDTDERFEPRFSFSMPF